MAAPDPSLPRNVPDLSLPEKKDAPPAPTREAPDLQKLVQTKPVTIERPRDFLEDLQEGDRVMAPWHPDVLLAGTTVEFDDTTKQVQIRYDFGETAWVFLNQLLPLTVAVGTDLAFRRSFGSQYVGGQVVEADGEDLFLELHDGTREWTTASTVLIPCEPFGPPARRTKSGSPTPSALSGWGLYLIIGVVLLVLCVLFTAR